MFKDLSRAVRLVAHWLRHHRLWLGLAAGGLAALIFIPVCGVWLATASYRYNGASSTGVQSVPERQVIVVLGAGILPDGSLTPYLKWRVTTAVDLYMAGKSHHLLMTGDNSSNTYNEPIRMKDYAVRLGIPPQAITLDYAGFSTYDSCYRAKHIFGVTSAIIVSQGYHVPRAVATCRSFGIDAVGVSAKHDGRDFTVSYLLREAVSTDKALFQMLFKPQPTVGGHPEK